MSGAPEPDALLRASNARALKAAVQPGTCDACGEPLGEHPEVRHVGVLRIGLWCERCAGEHRARHVIRLAPDAGTLADALLACAEAPWAQPHLAEIGWRIALWRAGLS